MIKRESKVQILKVFPFIEHLKVQRHFSSISRIPTIRINNCLKRNGWNSRGCCDEAILQMLYPEQQLSPLVDLTLEGCCRYLSHRRDMVLKVVATAVCVSPASNRPMGLFLWASFRPGISYPFIVISWYWFPNRESLPFIGCYLDFIDSAYQANSNSVWIKDSSPEWLSVT